MTPETKAELISLRQTYHNRYLSAFEQFTKYRNFEEKQRGTENEKRVQDIRIGWQEKALTWTAAIDEIDRRLKDV